MLFLAFAVLAAFLVFSIYESRQNGLLESDNEWLQGVVDAMEETNKQLVDQNQRLIQLNRQLVEDRFGKNPPGNDTPCS